MNHASCKHLTHPHAAYYGCTLAELTVISVATIGLALLLAGILALFWGRFFAFFIALFLMSCALVKVIAARLGRFKEGKAPGALKACALLWLHQHLGTSLPLLMRCGLWSTKRDTRGGAP